MVSKQIRFFQAEPAPEWQDCYVFMSFPLLWDVKVPSEGLKGLLGLQGAQLVFERFIVPVLKQYGSSIDPIFATTDQVCTPTPKLRKLKKDWEQPPEAEAHLRESPADLSKDSFAAAVHSERLLHLNIVPSASGLVGLLAMMLELQLCMTRYEPP